MDGQTDSHVVMIMQTCGSGNIKVSFFESSENIRKKEGRSDRPVSNKFSSVTLNELAKKARERYCNFNIS